MGLLDEYGRQFVPTTDEQGISGTQERVPAAPTASTAFGYCTQLDLGSFRVMQSLSRT